MTIKELALQCRKVYFRCAKINANIFGVSLLDLCADQIPGATLSELRQAITLSGLYVRVPERLQFEIVRYYFT